jgi:hypothetical protein
VTIFDEILKAQQLLGKSREHTLSAEEKTLFLLAIDALWFVWRNGQAYEFEGYREDIAANAPHRVIAAFKTHDEADAWLKTRPRPPDLALVLIADEYHAVLSSRDGTSSSLVPDSDLEYHLEEKMKEGLPPAVATFDRREEAEAWFAGQAEPPAQAVIQIGGEPYLAAYYRNIGHRALFPFSRVERLHARRQRRAREEPEADAPDSPSGPAPARGSGRGGRGEGP